MKKSTEVKQTLYHYPKGYKFTIRRSHKILFSTLYGLGLLLISGVIGSATYGSYQIANSFLQSAEFQESNMALDVPPLLLQSSFTPIENHQTEQVSPSHNRSFIAASEIYLIGGHNGLVRYSQDLKNWTSVKTGLENSIIDMATGHGKFIAIDRQGNLASSLTGTEWSLLPKPALFGTDKMERLTFNGSQFVALTQKGQIAISPNGQNWYQAGHKALSAIEQDAAPDRISTGSEDIQLISDQGSSVTKVRIYKTQTGRMLHQLSFSDGAYQAITYR